jgi:MFS family permease
MSVYYIFALNIVQGTGKAADKIVFALFALTMGAEPWVVGLLSAMFSFAAATSAVFVGKLMDQYGPRWLMVGGSFGATAGLILIYLLPSLPNLLTGGALCGLSLVCYNVTTQNLTGLLSNRDNRARNFSNYSLSNSLGSLIGPLIGGISIDHMGHRDSFLILIAMSLVPVIMVFARWRVMDVRKVKGGTSAHDEHNTGTLGLFRDIRVRNTIITASFLSSGLHLFTAYMPVYGHSIKLSASMIGIVMSANGMASIVVRVLLPKLISWLTEQRVMAYAFCFGAVSLFLIPLFEHPYMLGALAFLFGLGMGAGQPVVTMLIYQFAPRGRSGEAIGLKITTNHIASMITPVIFGGIATVAGLMPMFWMNGLMMLFGFRISWSKRW